MKKIAFLLALFALPAAVVNAGNGERRFYHEGTSDVFTLLGTNKHEVANTVRRVHARISDVRAPGHVLNNNLVGMVYGFNAVIREALPMSYHDKAVQSGCAIDEYFELSGFENERYIYTVPFSKLIDIWEKEITPAGPALWQFLANSLHADFTFYAGKSWDDDDIVPIIGPMGSVKSQIKSLENPARQIHIGVVRTTNYARYLIVKPPRGT
jgi:hypothetical protein